MPKKDTKILLAVLVVINIISLEVFWYIFNLTKRQITESVNKEDQIKMVLKTDDMRILMKDDLVLGKQYQNELMGYVLPADSTVEFIKTIEQLVSNTGLKADIKTVTNEPYDKGTAVGVEFIKIKLDVIGEWKNIQFFLKSLENYPLKIDIKKMTLHKFSDYVLRGRTIPQWSGSFEFTAVKLKDTK